jgi:hypothetical protein
VSSVWPAPADRPAHLATELGQLECVTDARRGRLIPLLAGLLTALALCAVYMVAARRIARAVVWLTFIILNLLFVAMTLVAAYKGELLSSKPFLTRVHGVLANAGIGTLEGAPQGSFRWDGVKKAGCMTRMFDLFFFCRQSAQRMFAFGSASGITYTATGDYRTGCCIATYMLAALTVIVFLVSVLILWRLIVISACMKVAEASSRWRVLFFPVVPFALFVALFVYWIWILALQWSASTVVEVSGTGCAAPSDTVSPGFMGRAESMQHSAPAALCLRQRQARMMWQQRHAMTTLTATTTYTSAMCNRCVAKLSVVHYKVS